MLNYFKLNFIKNVLFIKVYYIIDIMGLLSDIWCPWNILRMIPSKGYFLYAITVIYSLWYIYFSNSVDCIKSTLNYIKLISWRFLLFSIYRLCGQYIQIIQYSLAFIMPIADRVTRKDIIANLLKKYSCSVLIAINLGINVRF